MSTVSVSVGQTVAACQVVGAVGMTGRTFGPHLHFEAYPPGITPGDIYRAVSPATWLNARGLNP
jgi:murein DD-endopeptidase MepM/ murein hydrolase activator NlpD